MPEWKIHNKSVKGLFDAMGIDLKEFLQVKNNRKVEKLLNKANKNLDWGAMFWGAQHRNFNHDILAYPLWVALTDSKEQAILSFFHILIDKFFSFLPKPLRAALKAYLNEMDK